MTDPIGPRNIVLLFDGTSNEISADRTNVLRLYGTLEKSDQQLVWYDPGVGTLGGERSWLRLWRKTVEVWGLITGWGIDENVKEAYQFLLANHRRGRDSVTNEPWADRIHILGFSRGAYSARVLAGFIHAIGLVSPANLNLLDYAYRAYKRIDDSGTEKSLAEIRLFQRVLQPYFLPIRLLALFDTVASVIEDGRVLQLRTTAYTAHNPSVESIRHAVAIAERRTMFRPQLWPQGQSYQVDRKEPGIPQDVNEVWFTGVHGDVGGGYVEAESGLAKLPLKWLIDQTTPLGLRFEPSIVAELVLGDRPGDKHIEPNAGAEPHDSMTWGWAILEFLPRRRPADSRRRAFLGWQIPFFEDRDIPEGARIHRSVIDRIDAGTTRPANLPVVFEIEEPGPNLPQ